MIKYLSILVLLALFSCKDQNMSFDIGSKYVEINTNLQYIDTLMVRSFTVRLDSIRTSGLTEGVIMAGMYNDPEIGDVSATSYFRLGLPGSRTIPHDAVYDSVQLILLDNNYSIGDTLSPITFQVHRLNQTIKIGDDGYLYNTSSFSYNPELFGSISYLPKPNRNDTIKIDLDDSFGNELFNLLSDKDDKVSNMDNFLGYFKGIVLTSGGSAGAILGFSTSATLPAMRLYYHYLDFSLVNKYLDFPISSSTTHQFNQFTITNPVEEFPVKQSSKLPSGLTENLSYVQGATGLVTRFEIPYLRSLPELHQNMNILRAELVLEPARNTYKTIQLPQKVSLYTTDRLNRFGSPLRVQITGEIQEGTLVIDNLYQEESSYTFDVTDFISSKLTEESDDIPALLLTITPEDLYKTPDRLVLGSQLNSDNKVILKIYYMNYE